MLEAFLSSADLASIGLIIGIGGVAIAGFSVFRFASRFQEGIDSFGEIEYIAPSKNYQPLAQVFYKFDHASSEQWLNWVFCQEKAVQDLAFNKLADYLKEPLGELGSITEEVVKVVIQFKRTESYYILLELVRSSIRSWGQFKSINLFFEIAAKGMIKLNEENGFTNLKEHIDLIIERDSKSSDVLLISMIRAIGMIKNPRAEVVDYFSKLALNRNCSFNFKKEVLEEIRKLENDLDKYHVYLDILTGFLNATVLKFSDSDQKVLEELFTHIQKYIEENKPEIWELLVQCCQKDSTAEVFIEPLTEYLKYPKNLISSEQIASLFLIQEAAILDRIKEALALRFAFSEQDYKLINKSFKEDLEFDIKAVSLEKSKKTKNVINDLLDEYRQLEAVITANLIQLTKSEKRGINSITTILGEAEAEKLYLMRILAANLNHSFLYIDLDLILSSNYDLTELKTKINNSKPCILYLASLKDFLLKDFDNDQKIYAKKLINLATEMSKSPTVKVIASLIDNQDSINSNVDLKKILEKGSKGRFDLSISMNQPDSAIRRDLINNQIKEINASRINEKFNIEELVSILDNSSKIEILKFLNSYFSTSLFTQGKLLAVNDFIGFQQTGKLNIKLEEVELNV